MLFGGLQKNSFIDYPGKISCVIFAAGCNFHCPYCHNPDLVRGPFSGSGLLDEKVILAYLVGRRGLLDGVVISGGEPTLQNDLGSFCNRIKALGYPVKLDTNGSRPRVLKELIRQGAVDYIAMDLKTTPKNYLPLSSEALDPGLILESIRTVMASGLPYEFRTTCAKPFVDLEIIEKMGELIKGARRWALQGFRISDRILDPGFFDAKGWGYEGDTLLELKALAEPWVKKCIIR